MSILTQKKQCSSCREWKPLSEFRKGKRYKYGVQGQCRVCQRAKNRQYVKNNLPKIEAYTKEWIKKNHDRYLQRERQRYSSNPENAKARSKKYRQGHKEEVNQRLRDWFSRNPEKRVEYNRQRYARKVGGKITNQEWGMVLDRYGHKCLRCGRMDVKLTVDHVIPLVCGGSHAINNVQPLCQSCNSIKNNKTEDYRYDKGVWN